MIEESEYEVVFHERPSGRCPMDEFLDRLPVKVRAKLMRWIEKLEAEGPNLPRPYSDVLRGKIRELRLQFGNHQYRCLYFFDGKRIVMTHAFMKKTDRVPEGEIEYAESLMKEYHHEKIQR